MEIEHAARFGSTGAEYICPRCTDASMSYNTPTEAECRRCGFEMEKDNRFLRGSPLRFHVQR